MTNGDKREVREAIRRVLKAIPADERAEMSLLICRNIISLDVFKTARVIMAYMPYGFEVDVRPLIGEAYGLHKRVGLPVVTGNGTMKAVQADKDCAMRAGEYGILCPSEGKEIAPRDIDLVIVPGLAFDKNGGRLGKGGGYYDRFLRECEAVAVAPAFSQQVLEKAPTDESDVPVDILATERLIIKCEKLTRN